ncbi:auxilin-related protein 2-like isoform X2 [Andrographis paniculata]|uniref:auxilin-related protein 2-like isoform X2 n=1 Tax=Andrographis paniculata TaxID=175694 RepID=UPI0021E7E6A7|nr:auxilin-related protein 2-like isoform X2 [Andrographis paniculata]
MDNLDVLSRDFGLGTSGKANPMRSLLADRRGAGDPLFQNVIGGWSKYPPSSNSNGNQKQSGLGDLNYDSVFQSTAKKSNDKVNFSPYAAHDKQAYDNDAFEGLPGVRSETGGLTTKFYDDVFGSMSTPATAIGRSQNRNSNFDDLLGNIGRNRKIVEKNKTTSVKSSMNSKGFDDFLAGFGSENSDAAARSVPESRWRSVPNAGSNKQGNILGDPFIVLESSSTPNSSSGRSGPLEEIGKLNKSRSTRVEAPPDGGTFDHLDLLSNIGKHARSFPHVKDNGGKYGNSISTSESATAKEPMGNSSFGFPKRNMKKKVSVYAFQEPPSFDRPNVLTVFQTFSDQAASSLRPHETSPQVDTPTTLGQGQQIDDVWFTVSYISLFTQPSTAPPPSRPPPCIPRQTSRLETKSSSSRFRRKGGEVSSPSSYIHCSQSSNLTKDESSSLPTSLYSELAKLSTGRPHNNFQESVNPYHNKNADSFSIAAESAAAIEEAMDKAEAKFRHAKEVREREHARSARNKEHERVEKDERQAQFREFRETQVTSERERKHKEEEREQRQLEKERLRETEMEKARQAVERATREARERTATEVRLRAERAAVAKANAEARERAERAAVHRAQTEARERAAAEAKERADKAAVEGRERALAAELREKEVQKIAAVSRAAAESKHQAERAAVERAAAEARERAAAQAREMAASAARMNQQKTGNDLESFFSMGRGSRAPRASSNTTLHRKVGSDAAKAPPYSSGASTTKKASSATNLVDDLFSVFGAAPSGEFKVVEGEPDERRKARMERHQRTQERAAQALAEKNQRDLQTQREQEERQRIAETADVEIRRWAAGKEGNLRALLSTLQFVLWPGCGWQPVSLTDLIVTASVKKAYRKATLCIHPDKVQQKGATLQQKYVAEKVFDLLKESWNKFNSEEIF